MRITQRDILKRFDEIVNAKSPLQPETCLRDVFRGRDDDPKYDPLLLAQYIWLRHGIAISDREWHKVLLQEVCTDEDWDLLWIDWDDVSEHATFGELANAFLKRIPAPQFKPLNICFQDCRPAGVFEDLRYLARLCEEHSGVQITPSARLNKVIGSRSLEFFWKRLQLSLKNQLPETKNCFRHLWFRCGYFSVLAAICLSVLLIGSLLPAYFAVILPFLFFGVAYLGVRISSYHWAPEGVMTFRDLSVLIADTIDNKRVPWRTAGRHKTRSPQV